MRYERFGKIWPPSTAIFQKKIIAGNASVNLKNILYDSKSTHIGLKVSENRLLGNSVWTASQLLRPALHYYPSTTTVVSHLYWLNVLFLLSLSLILWLYCTNSPNNIIFTLFLGRTSVYTSERIDFVCAYVCSVYNTNSLSHWLSVNERVRGSLHIVRSHNVWHFSTRILQ